MAGVLRPRHCEQRSTAARRRGGARMSTLRHRWLTGVMALLVATTVAGGGVGDAQQASGARIDLKVLLITGDPSDSSFEVWVDLLKSEQVPFDVFDASSGGTLTEGDLRSGDRAFYQGVVCSTECSDLSDTELAALDAFQADFDVRRVNAYAWPGTDYGLTSPSFSGFLDGQVGQVTAAGAGVFSYLVGQVPLDEWTWGFTATPLPGSGHTVLVEGPGGASWVGVIDNPAGFEEMVVTIESGTDQFHSLLLGHGQLAWVTRGVYLGYSRNYYSAHFDDIFLSSDRWDLDDNTTYHDSGATNPLIRMTDADAERLIRWTTQTGVRLDMAFNGEGSDRVVAAQGSDPLADVLLADKDRFGWINHTYEHGDLDAADTEEARSEILQNIEFAAAHDIPIDPEELITGRHSGIFNPAVHVVLEEFGIEWVAAKLSNVPEPTPAGPATVVPRYASSLYYNIGTVAELVDQFNYITYENCDPTRRQCRSQPATWNQIRDWEAEIMLGHILGNQPEPHYFHQGNLAEEGTFYLVFDEVLERYRDHVAVELVQPQMSEAGRYLVRANDWEAARPSVAGYLQGGSLHLTSPVAALVPVTGLPGGEDYGGLPSGWVTVEAGVERVIPLGTPPVDVVAPVITILGANPLEVPVGGPFVDPGVTAVDDIDGDLTANVTTDISALDLDTPGNYLVTYTVSDTAGNPTEATRTIEVTDTPPVDVVPPVITVLGANPLEVPVGGPFIDPGVTAVDDVDGDLTANVTTGLTALDLAVPGNYLVTYTVSDTAGNPTEATRTVEVTETGPTVGVVEVRVTSGSDDVEERGDGTLEIGSGDLEITEENTLQVVGLRFVGIDIPQGAQITAAWLQFTVDEPTGRTTTLIIGAHNIGDAPAFGGHGDLRSRPQGAATVTWNPARWVAAGDTTPAQRTPDLTTIIQQLTNRSDWTPGSAIALIIDGTGKRIAESYEGSPTQAPLLHIEYTTTPAGNTAPIVTATGSGTTAPGDATLQGTITDDGLPDPPAAVGTLWEQTAGPAAATIADPASPSTTVFLPEPGDYTFSLTAKDTELTASATVTITASEAPPVDVVPPVITVLGSNPLEVPVGGPFIDPGVTALDDVDGDLTANVITDLTALDLNTPGTYLVTYTVSDTAGNPGVATRTIEVTETGPTVGVVEVRVTSGSNDVEERGDGTLEIGSGDLEITEENTLQVVGLRFTGIEIPQGAHITAAWLQHLEPGPLGGRRRHHPSPTHPRPHHPHPTTHQPGRLDTRLSHRPHHRRNRQTNRRILRRLPHPSTPPPHRIHHGWGLRPVPRVSAGGLGDGAAVLLESGGAVMASTRPTAPPDRMIHGVVRALLYVAPLWVVVMATWREGSPFAL